MSSSAFAEGQEESADRIRAWVVGGVQGQSLCLCLGCCGDFSRDFAEPNWKGTSSMEKTK